MEKVTIILNDDDAAKVAEAIASCLLKEEEEKAMFTRLGYGVPQTILKYIDAYKRTLDVVFEAMRK